MVCIVCDRCGRAIPKDEKVWFMQIGVRHATEGDPPEGDAFEGKDYCGACADEARKFMEAAAKTVRRRKTAEDAGQRQETAEDAGLQAPRKPQEAPAGRRRLDIGKVMALRNAGWPIKEIALEMGLNPQVVSNAICRHNRKADMDKNEGSDGE